MTSQAGGVQWDRPWDPLEPSGGEPPPADTPLGAVALDEALAGELVESDRGAFLRVMNAQDIDVARSGRASDDSGRRALAVAFNDPEAREFDLHRAVVIDVETTGLAGGTGTYAFLIGCGWVEDGALRVEQYFMRDQADEPALLAHLAEQLRRFDWVVTFNGASFDIPLLETRFIMNRMRAGIGARGSLDVLQAARRLWRFLLPDRSLAALERDLLGEWRRGDVPGDLIPHIYFHFSRTGDARRLPAVFEHNRRDIVTTVRLLDCARRTCRDWRDPERHPAEVLGAARAFQLAADQATAAEAFARALRLGLEGDLRAYAHTHLSLHHKRAGAWGEAAGIWRAMVANEDRTGLWALVELAKFHEHRRRDFPGALAATRRGLALTDALGTPLPAELRRPALDHRLRRLERRLASSRTIAVR